MFPLVVLNTTNKINHREQVDHDVIIPISPGDTRHDGAGPVQVPQL